MGIPDIMIQVTLAVGKPDPLSQSPTMKRQIENLKLPDLMMTPGSDPTLFVTVTATTFAFNSAEFQVQVLSLFAPSHASPGDCDPDRDRPY